MHHQSGNNSHIKIICVMIDVDESEGLGFGVQGLGFMGRVKMKHLIPFLLQHTLSRRTYWTLSPMIVTVGNPSSSRRTTLDATDTCHHQIQSSKPDSFDRNEDALKSDLAKVIADGNSDGIRHCSVEVLVIFRHLYSRRFHALSTSTSNHLLRSARGGAC